MKKDKCHRRETTVGFLAKAAKVMDKIADNEADIIEAGGWGNKLLADKIRPKPDKKKPDKKK